MNSFRPLPVRVSCAGLLVLVTPLLSACFLTQVCTPDGDDCVIGVGAQYFRCPNGGGVWARTKSEALGKCNTSTPTPKLAQGTDMSIASNGAPITVTSAPTQFTLTVRSGSGASVDSRVYSVSMSGTTIQFANPASIDTWVESYFASNPDMYVEVSGSNIVFDAPGTYNNQVVTVTGTISHNGVPKDVSSHAYVYQMGGDPEPPTEMY